MPATLPVKWEELTALEFVKAVEQAQGVCLLPLGILEKHGPHLPLGTDLLNVRWNAVEAAQREYALVFPEYYVGQIFEARQQPGTISYSPRLQLELLQETVAEIARNGCSKIVLLNGHGGNNHLLGYFLQTQLASPRDYVLYSFNVWTAGTRLPNRPKLQSAFDEHAGEGETSQMLICRPDLVHMEQTGRQSGADLKRLALPPGLDTAMWWYARFPNHYGGDAGKANPALGEFDMRASVAAVSEIIRAVKADQVTPRLQKEYFERSQAPLRTPEVRNG